MNASKSVILLVLLSLWFLRCSESPVAGGSDNPDFLIGTLTLPGGTTVTNAVVLCIPDTFDPCNDTAATHIFADTTDATGTYRFKRLTAGTYNLLATHQATGMQTFIGNIQVGIDSLTIPPATLLAPGTIKVTLFDEVDPVIGYICIRGTNIARAILPGQQYVMLDSVPPGTLPSVYYTEKNSVQPPQIIIDSVTVHSNSTVTVVLSAYSRELQLNTTSSGAAVTNDVYHFPVLVRLTSQNFTFAQAKGNGEDIRFTKSDNSPLAYEIERWDSTAGTADVWVHIDTVFGNNSTQSFRMHWGNSAAHDSSNSAAVFDTSNGFQGVWHMGQNGNTTAPDATLNGYDGTPTGMSAASAVSGMIGRGQKFDGATSGITLDNTASSKLNFFRNGYYTLSAWVYADTLDSLFHPIVGKSDFQYGLQIRRTDEWDFFIMKDSLYETIRMPAVSRAWKYVVGIRNNDKQSMYIDGALVNNTLAHTIPVPSAVEDSTRNVMIGFDQELGRYWKGIIDEVRITNKTLSADWIKLCYMNQKSVDALVVFKP